MMMVDIALHLGDIIARRPMFIITVIITIISSGSSSSFGSDHSRVTSMSRLIRGLSTGHTAPDNATATTRALARAKTGDFEE